MTDRVVIPSQLRERAVGWGGAEGAAWLDALPDTVDGIVAKWDLALGDPYDSHISFAAPAKWRGRGVVLKIPMAGDFPYVTGNLRFEEHRALDMWDGDGAIQLLAFDPPTGAMLLERCIPGDHLADRVPLERADEIVAGLLRRLWRPVAEPHPFATLRSFADDLEVRAVADYERGGSAMESSMLTDALDMLTELRCTVTEALLLHGDLHHKNVLLAHREPWLAIDPLPRVGDAAYDAVQFLLFRKGSTPEPEVSWGRDIARFCERVDLDPARVTAWIYVRLVTDALASLAHGASIEELEAYQDDLWSARLARSLL